LTGGASALPRKRISSLMSASANSLSPAATRAIAGRVGQIGLAVRVGLHTGECQLMEGKVGGIAVHIGARIAQEAQPGEVLVSSTVKDLVAGSGIEFEDRGAHELKGVPGKWQLYSVIARG
jgi:class 3 adenylate cyclase